MILCDRDRTVDPRVVTTWFSLVPPLPPTVDSETSLPGRRRQEKKGEGGGSWEVPLALSSLGALLLPSPPIASATQCNLKL